MPRVIFTENFDYKPAAQQTLSYKAGDVVLLKQDVADIVLDLGKAELTNEPVAASINDTIKRFPAKKRKENTVVDNEVIQEGELVEPNANEDADEVPAEVLLEENALTEDEVISEEVAEKSDTK